MTINIVLRVVISYISDQISLPVHAARKEQTKIKNPKGKKRKATNANNILSITLLHALIHIYIYLTLTHSLTSSSCLFIYSPRSLDCLLALASLIDIPEVRNNMSTGQDIAPEQHHVCYVHCNFCSTILAVSVPRNCLFSMVTVRCGHCTNLLSVNMAPLLQPLAHQDQQVQNKESNIVTSPREINLQSSVTNNHRLPMPSDLPETSPIRPPEKRQRVPSAYNKFIKEEIQRIKASNPEISHREAFSAAAKNWAHLPRIHKGMTFDETSSPLLQDAHGFH